MDYDEKCLFSKYLFFGIPLASMSSSNNAIFATAVEFATPATVEQFSLLGLSNGGSPEESASQGCDRQSAAVARLLGSITKRDSRNSAASLASGSGNLYFSRSTSRRHQKFNC